jgi:hypothetical protein
MAREVSEDRPLELRLRDSKGKSKLVDCMYIEGSGTGPRVFENQEAHVAEAQQAIKEDIFVQEANVFRHW